MIRFPSSAVQTMAFDTYRLITDIKAPGRWRGQAADKAWRGWIEIFSFSWGASNPTTVGTTAGGTVRGEGLGVQLQHHEEAGKLLDEPVPACCTGQHYTRLVVEMRKASGLDGGQKTFLKYTFEHVMVESVQWSGSTGGDDTPTESVSFAFAKVTMDILQAGHEGGHEAGRHRQLRRRRRSRSDPGASPGVGAASVVLATPGSGRWPSLAAPPARHRHAESERGLPGGGHGERGPNRRGGTMNASDLYKDGRLREAIEAQVQEVKASPTDHAKRLFLFELLFFAGDLERARRQIEAIEYKDPDLDAAAAVYRKLLDAEQARRDLFARGVAPGFFGEPSEHLRLRLDAVNRLREGRPAEAAEALRRANEAIPPFTGRLNGKPFESLRDADDLFRGRPGGHGPRPVFLGRTGAGAAADDESAAIPPRPAVHPRPPRAG